MKRLVILLVISATISIWYRARQPINYPPGVLVPSDPTQTDTADESFTCGAFTLKPLAHFALDARLLHCKVYRYDREAALVPIDLALGWGAMSDQQVLDRITISQTMRFYWFEYKLPPPIPKEEIITHSTNMHVIPATPEIAARCTALRVGTLVHLEGNLVEATAPGWAPWRSSLSRSDSGNGACELIWLQGLTILAARDAQQRGTRR